jgi:hypothetical protein
MAIKWAIGVENHGSQMEMSFPTDSNRSTTPNGIARQVLSGGRWGLAIWSCYAAVEYFCFTVIPLLGSRNAILTLLNCKLNAVLFFLYALIGVLAGALSGLAIAAFNARMGTQPVYGQSLAKAGARMTLLLAAY